MFIAESFASTAAAVVGLGVFRIGVDATELGTLPDESLLAAYTLLAEHVNSAQLLAASLAAEIGRRSSRDAGYSGLSQRKGFGSAEGLLQAISPVSRGDATQLIEAGSLMAATDTLWEAALAAAMNVGSLSVPAADAIRRGLAQVAEFSPADDLLTECQRLIERCPAVSLDELRRESRSARDRLDEAGIARREKQRRDNRYLKRWVRDDGMYQGAFLLDPENGLEVFTTLDAIMAPRRGIRFVDATAQADAQGVIDDPRTNDQLLADAFVDMVRLAVDADPGTLFGGGRPAVRVHVTADVLAGNDGHGHLEGDPQPVSLATVERHICNTGILGIKFDRKNNPIDLGRTQRNFTTLQRIALAARDGGCVFGECNRPPSACEAHHIVEWGHGGCTDVANGVLLCRHHHMLVHNNGWQIVRERDQYWLRAPRSEDPLRRLRPMQSKSPLMRELTPAS